MRIELLKILRIRVSNLCLFFVFGTSLRYLDQLGMASKYKTKVYCRQTLIGGNYGLLNTGTFIPNPDFYRQDVVEIVILFFVLGSDGGILSKLFLFVFYFQLAWDPETFFSFPFLNSALLWDRLMGTSVLAVNSDASPFFRSYAHCSKGRVRLHYFSASPSYFEL